MQKKMLKIGVFYDGNYFLHVSNYYNYDHPRRRRLSISGLHDFVRHQVAQEEGVDFRLSQIVDAHYFRGRLNAYEAASRARWEPKAGSAARLTFRACPACGRT
jgi:hypothetical protein